MKIATKARMREGTKKHQKAAIIPVFAVFESFLHRSLPSVTNCQKVATSFG